MQDQLQRQKGEADPINKGIHAEMTQFGRSCETEHILYFYDIEAHVRRAVEEGI